MRRSWTALSPPLLLTALWVAAALLVNPVGEFPLNDGFAYATPVHSLLHEGRLVFLPWGAPTLVAQVLWGALFCVPFGFSFTALRLSGLVSGWLGVLATYALVREAGGTRSVALLGALTVAVSPLYLATSFSFMTEPPTVACSMLALLCLLRGARRDDWRQILLGSLLVGLAVLVRQTVIVVAFAFTLACSLTLVRRRRLGWLPALAPSVVGLAALGLYELGLRPALGLPALFRETDAALDGQVLQRLGVTFLERGGMVLVYMGLFLLPLLVACRPRSWHRPGPWRLVRTLGYGGCLAGGVWLCVHLDEFLPFTGNYLFDLGLGPRTLRDTYELGLHPLPRAGFRLWYTLTLVGIAGAAAIAEHLVRALKPSHHPRAGLPALTAAFACLLYFGVVVIEREFFDRHLVFFLPLGAVIFPTVSAGGARSRKPLLPAAALLLVWAWFAVAGTHDYLGWNRARWTALGQLLGQGVSDAEIDGGFEFNGWQRYDPDYQASPDRSGWWVEDDVWVVSFGPLPGYREVRRVPYDRWLPPSEGAVLLLRRLDPDSAGHAASGAAAPGAGGVLHQ